MDAQARLQGENDELRRQLGDAEDALRAIREGQVDAIVVDGAQGTQIFSLAGAERIYRVLVETMLEAALAVSPDGTILFCNGRFCDLMRMALPETLGRDLGAFIAGEQQAALEAFLTVARTGPANGQFVMLASDGTPVPVKLAANPLDEGDAPNVCVVASDLSQLEESSRSVHVLLEHQRAMEAAEAALRESEQRLSFAQAAAGAGIWDWNIPTGEIAWTEELYRLFGLDPAQDRAGFDAWRGVIHPDDRAEADERIARAIATRSRLWSEYRVVLPSGEERWISAIGDTTFGADGTPLRMSGICVDITARKQIEEVARHRLAEIEDIYRSAPVGLCVLDPELRYVRINERLAEINGIPAADHIGKRVRDVLPELADVVEPQMRRVLEAGEPRLDIEVVAQTPAQPGIERSWLEQWLPITDDDGSVIGLSVVVEETTEKKRTDAALRESEQRLRRMIETAPVAIGFGDSGGKIFEANEAFYRLTGYTREEIRASQLGWNQLTAPEYAELDRHIMATLAETGSAGPYQKEYIRKDGSRVPLLLTASNISGPDEHVAFIVDISQRIAAEEALRRTEEDRKVGEAVRAERQRLFDVLETLPAMICLLTRDHHVAFANRSFRETYGESEGRRCYEYCFGHTAPCEFCRTYDVLETGKPVHWEATTPGGRVIDVHDVPFTDPDGAPMILEMELDITERRRVEQELQHAHNDLAERAEQLRALARELTLSEQRERQRLARVLHDHLQQLLVGAKFRTAIVARMGDALVRQAAVEIERLLDESIAASRSLTSELSPPVLHEGGVTAGLEWLARWMANRHGLRVSLSLEDNLPELAEEIRILLFESVRELLFNAVKHAHVTTAHVNVRRVERGDIQITVSDAGPGFDPAASRKAGETGGGFGLFGIRERLEIMGGRLDIDSAPGKGSRFSLTAPVDRAAGMARPEAPAPATPVTARPAARPRAAGRGAQITVLIADDHAVVREGFRRLLGQERDMRIVGEAVDGREAVELAGALRPDVILMDVSMPNLNGLQAARAIHRDDPEIRIIGLSMFEDEEHANAMKEAGAVDYLTKSGPPSDLIHAIHRACPQPAQPEDPPVPHRRTRTQKD